MADDKLPRNGCAVHAEFKRFPRPHVEIDAKFVRMGYDYNDLMDYCEAALGLSAAELRVDKVAGPEKTVYCIQAKEAKPANSSWHWPGRRAA